MVHSTAVGSCLECGGVVPATAAYCPGCGTPVERAEGVACLACREINRATSRFCSACGAHMASVADAERRIITVLFADLSGFTPLTEELDPEMVRDLIAGCLEPICDCVTRSGGFVDKFIGDCVMALFGAPVSYENEEERAIRAALEMHDAIAAWAESRSGDPWAGAYQPRLSIGINTGPVVTGLFSGGGTHNYTAVGDAVNVAARLQGQCEPGRILVGPATYRNARQLFDFEEERLLQLKGRHEPVAARYVKSVRSERGRMRGIGGAATPLIGRDADLEALRERWQVARSGRPSICLLVGPPGIGKTRLTEELVAEEGLGAAQLVRGRSYPYARSTPWEPLAALVRELYGVGPDAEAVEAASRIVRAAGGRWEAEEEADLVGILGGPVPSGPDRAPDERQERAAAVLRRLLSWGGRAPRLLVLEDLHWADGSTLAFLAGLSTSDLSGPVLLVLVTRPPTEDETRLEAVLRAVPDRIDLATLTPEETRRLIDGILGEHALPEEAVEAIVARADGMPFFIEELLKMSMAEGSLYRDEQGRWTVADQWELDVPETIESLLSARIDALRPATKRALQYAAIVGRRFWPSVLRDRLVGSPVEDELDALVEAAIVSEEPESLIPDEREHAFQHLMLHEVAYEGILRRSREELHGSVAEWLEARVSRHTPEIDDLIAYHYEHSVSPGKAVPFLERGAHEAMSRGGLEDARVHIDRALVLCGPGPDRTRLLLEAERLAASAGDAGARARTLDELAEAADRTDDKGLAGEVQLRRAAAAFDAGDLAAARAAGREADRAFRELGDISRRGDALRLLGREAHQRGDHETAEAFYDSALELEREAGDRWGEAEILDFRGLLEVDRDRYEEAVGSFDRAIRICEEIEDTLLQARALAHRATALRWMGCLDDAWDNASRALELARAGGSPRTIAACEMVLGGVGADAGREEEARSLLRRVLRSAVRMELPAVVASAWLELAWLGEGADAEEAAAGAERAAAEAELVHVEILAISRRAELALAAGDLVTAVRASGEAVERLSRHGSIVGPEERILRARREALEAAGEREAAARVAADLELRIEERAARIRNPERKAAYLARHGAAGADPTSTGEDR